MSRITLTKKANGRYYLGMDAEDFKWLRQCVSDHGAAMAAANIQWPPKTQPERAQCDHIRRLSAVLEKPARGEA